MKLQVKDMQGNPQGELEVQFPLVEDGRYTQAVHDTTVAYLAAQRSGTACTKTLAEVAGTGKKPWRQKGTGRARAGSFASPLWRGGGVVFGPKPRDYRQRVSLTTRKLALRTALSQRLKASHVVVVDELKLESHKTKEFLKLLSALQVEGTVLVVVPRVEPNLALSSRNVPGVALTTSSSLNTYQVLRCDTLLFTKSAFAQVEQRLTQS
jgi:large subunit ribosomal protein L4